MKWQHDETGRVCESPTCPGERWDAIPQYATQEQREFYEGFKSIDDPTSPPGIIRLTIPRFDGFASPESRIANFERDESNAEKLDNLTHAHRVLRDAVEQVINAGHMNTEDLARLRAAWENT